MQRHPFDLLSLLLGLAVTSAAVVGATDAWRLDPAPWLWPTVLVATGVVLLLAMATASRQATPVTDAASPSATTDVDDLRSRSRAELDAHDPLGATAGDAEPTTTPVDPPDDGR